MLRVETPPRMTMNQLEPEPRRAIAVFGCAAREDGTPSPALRRRLRTALRLAEEQPAAYKDVNQVVNVVHQANLASKVARMRPIGVVKG